MLRMVSIPKSVKKIALFSTMTNQVNQEAKAFEPVTKTPSTIHLESARRLHLPTYQEMLQRDRKVYDFWNENESTLEEAWKEWNKNDEEAVALPALDASIISPKLRAAVEAVWKDPSSENERIIKELWEEVAPGVFAIQFFDLEELTKLRQWFDTCAASGIPVRPPYGIVLNRKGMMTDPKSVGYLAAPDFQTFYRLLIDEYIRPFGRLFFPENIRESDDSHTFSFSIQYQGADGGDKSIRHHTDASTLTFNMNMDSSKTWSGSSLIFMHPDRQSTTEVHWKPGYAIMHLGQTMHAALPIESGTRSNWVIWTMGKGANGAYGNPLLSLGDECYPEEYQMTPEQRWTKPDPFGKIDYGNRWSPF